MSKSTIHLNKYKITKMDDGNIWIEIVGDEESGSFPLEDFENAVDQYYKENY